MSASPLTEEPTDEVVHHPPPSRTRSTVEWIVVIAGAIAVAFILKTFLVQAFFIPSGSMEPTLAIDDRVLVNKLSYRFGEPERGDIIVFARPETSPRGPDEIEDLIKRVVGLPGDSIVIENGKVAVNGAVLDEAYLPEGTVTQNGMLPCTAAAPCEVPDDELFVMGDNRGNSQDSRYIGTIEASSVVGEAFVRIWPFSRAGGL